MSVRKKKGMSDVITTMLLIVITLAVFGVVAGIIVSQMNKGSGKVAVKQACSEADLRISGCNYDPSNREFVYTVKRGAGNVNSNLTNISVVVKYANGGAKELFPFGKNEMLAPLESRRFSVSDSDEVKRTSVVGIVLVDEKQERCPESAEAVCSSGALIDLPGSPSSGEAGSSQQPSVNQPPSITLSVSATTITLGEVVTIRATATDPGGSISRVQFLKDGVNFGSPDTSSPYEITWTPESADVGEHAFTAIATDNLGAPTTSAPVAVTVAVAVSGGAPLPSGYLTGGVIAGGITGNTIAIGIVLSMSGLVLIRLRRIK